MDLQTKLKVSEPEDVYEQEADPVAEQVLTATAHSAIGGAPPRIQRFSGQPTGPTDAAPASVDQALAGSGRPLELALRQGMEQRFGHDFSRVRVYSGAAAEQSARDVNAHAYTVGQDIVFDAGRFAPETQVGRQLIAHELTHVVQQSGAEGIRAGQSNEKRDLSLIIGLEASLAPAPIRICRAPTPGGPGGGGAPRPSWLSGVPVVAHVQGNIYKIDLSGYGQTYVGPYQELANFVAKNNISLESHHIVGDEFIGMVRTGYTYETMPAVALHPKGHEPITTSIGAQLRWYGGRRGGRVQLNATQIAGIYKEAYTQGTYAAEEGAIVYGATPFKELYIITKNVLGLPHEAPVKPPSGSPQAVPPPSKTAAPPAGQPPGPSKTTAPTQAGGTPPDTSGGGGRTLIAGRGGLVPPIVTHGPSATRTAAANGLAELAQFGNRVLGRFADAKQAELAQAAIAKHLESTASLWATNPEQGLLLTVTWEVWHHTAGDVRRFISVTKKQGLTEALARGTKGNVMVEQPNPKADIQTDEIWIDPPAPEAVHNLPAPFPKIALATFARSEEVQDVKWRGLSTFDDAGFTSLKPVPGAVASFFVLQPPSEITFRNGSLRVTASIPILHRDAPGGWTIPVVNLDTVVGYIPFVDRDTAAMVVPADAYTAALFKGSDPVKDRLSQLRLYDFRSVRFVSPDNIKVLQSLSESNVPTPHLIRQAKEAEKEKAFFEGLKEFERAKRDNPWWPKGEPESGGIEWDRYKATWKSKR